MSAAASPARRPEPVALLPAAATVTVMAPVSPTLPEMAESGVAGIDQLAVGNADRIAIAAVAIALFGDDRDAPQAVITRRGKGLVVLANVSRGDERTENATDAMPRSFLKLVIAAVPVCG